jgi:D-arabinose 1-dehydrogenase-like Zn-dependent alcohol dehydrogenase
VDGKIAAGMMRCTLTTARVLMGKVRVQLSCNSVMCFCASAVRSFVFGSLCCFSPTSVTQGGYAERVRLQSDFAFKIPDQLSSVEAAPLMCGGVTTFAPLARFITRKGMRVGVIGIGGLGHMGCKEVAI